MRFGGSPLRTGSRVPDLSHRRVQLDVQALGQSHGDTGVAVPDGQVAAGEFKVVILRESSFFFFVSNSMMKRVYEVSIYQVKLAACTDLVPVFEGEGGEGCGVGKLQVGKVPVQDLAIPG